VNLHISKKLSDAPKVRVVQGRPGLYAIQLGDATDALHCTRRELTAWMSSVLNQIETLEREPMVVSE
jgi:hypothetical protein